MRGVIGWCKIQDARYSNINAGNAFDTRQIFVKGGKKMNKIKMYCVISIAAMIVILSWLTCLSGTADAAAKVEIGKAIPASSSEWEALVKAAQKEGIVNIYSTRLGKAQQAAMDTFKKKFGVNLSYNIVYASEMLARITPERLAGIYSVDAAHFGETSMLKDIKPLNITLPLSDLLLLPEVKSPSNWIGGKLPFLDAERTIFMYLAMSIPPGCYNTDMVKKNELISFLDLLQPKWKGKIAMFDPTVNGTSLNIFTALTKIWGDEQALSFFRQLAAQEPFITRDSRILVESVAREKYLVGIGQEPPMMQDFMQSGAHIRELNFKEPRHISAGPGSVVAFNNNPHPKATQLYINWILSKEGSAIMSKGTGFPSQRADLAAEGLLDPIYSPRPQDIYPDLERLNKSTIVRKIAADVFGIK